jgi:IS1 family transposase
MNQLSIQDRVQILNCLSEGMGINGTARLTGKSKNTVLKLLCDVGEACAAYQDRVMNGLNIARLECDEVWSYVGSKQMNKRPSNPAHADYGDVYTYTCIDPDTKLMPCWLAGTRNAANTRAFMADLAPRIATERIQITTDGYQAYPDAIEAAFGKNVDYAYLNKTYAGDGNVIEAKRRYSPTEMVKVEKRVVWGNPDPKHISTSKVERSNLTLRMSNRRFARLTNAFSKKLANHMYAISFFFMVYNFVKIHSTIKTTPAMEAGVTDFLWSMEDVVLMAETNA